MLLRMWMGGEPELARSLERAASVDLRECTPGGEGEELDVCNLLSTLSPDDAVLVLRGRMP